MNWLDSLENVLRETRWPPAHRITMSLLMLEAVRDADSASGYSVLADGRAAALAQKTGLSERAVRDIMATFAEAGLVERHINRTATAVNRYGESLPLRSAKAEHGDRVRWNCESTIALRQLPDVLPELTPGRNKVQARERATRERGRVAALELQLQELLTGATCPHCGAADSLQAHVSATCLDCGAVLDAAEIDALVSPTPAPRAQKPETANFAACENPAETDAGHPKRQTLPHNCFEAANFAGQGIETPIVGDITPSPSVFPADIIETANFAASGETLTGPAIVRALADMGAAFSLAHRPGEPKPKDDGTYSGKEGMSGDYLDRPATLAQAIRHVETGAPVGLLAEHSVGLHLFDVDAGAAAFLGMSPRLAAAPRLFRRNAPERVKVLFRLADGEPLDYLMLKGDGHKVELFGTRHHAIVAGPHHSGAAIELQPGVLPVLTAAEVRAIMHAFVPNPERPQAKPAPQRAPRPQAGQGDMLRAAIAWWNVQPGNRQAVDRLLSQCRHAGQFVAVRPDDGTPSTRAISGDAWHDYGTGETLDTFELWCRLTGTAKRTEKWRIVNDWRQAQGLQPLRLH